ncbi:hypothetical protein CMI37_17045 [Candidatus Pacearchaeota archaeon]|nr:hypothetical protein [Candidatus Pacearchaeota archaeon]
MNSIFNLFTTTETSNTHLLEENRNEDTAIPKFIEVIEEFASVANSPGEQRFEGVSIIDEEAALKTYSDEELERLLIQADEEGDSQLFSMIEDERIDREPVTDLVQLAIDLDAQQLPTVEDYPELDQEHRDTAFTKRSAAHGSIPSL